MESFIGWIGGKKLLRKTIAERFPQDIGKYVEVFGGAGWMLFYKDSHAKNEVFNDINRDLVNLFKCIKYHPEAIVKDMELLLNARETFEFLKNQNAEGLTDIQRAARYLYLIRASYGCKMKHYGARSRDLLRFDNLDDIQKRLSKVVIENQSFDKILDKYDSPDTLFYLDPPYYKAEYFYDTGAFVFDESQHEVLRNKLCGIKGKFVLSYNDCGYIRELYKGFKTDACSRRSNLAAKYDAGKQYAELIISNY